MLCDTSTWIITTNRLLFGGGPQVCINTPFELAVAVRGGKSPIYKWNEGSWRRGLRQIKQAIYEVTVTDACGQTARASIQVGSEIWLGPPSVGIALGPKVCINTNFILSASAAGGRCFHL